jgi:hypothetical protein
MVRAKIEAENNGARTFQEILKKTLPVSYVVK